MFSNLSSQRELTPQIDAVVFLDRSIDLLTPLSTQLTYEGLIDELYGIKHGMTDLVPLYMRTCNVGWTVKVASLLGCAKFPRQMFSEDIQAVPKGAPPPKGPMTILLNSEETMFAELRDLNFSSVGLYLSKEAKKITEAFKVWPIVVFGNTMVGSDYHTGEITTAQFIMTIDIVDIFC